MKSFLKYFLLTGLLVSNAAILQAQTTINFTSPAFEKGKNSSGAILTSSYTFELGSFGSFTPSALNVADWATNFTVLGSTTWGESFTQYSGTGNLTHNNSPFTTSDQGFVWGYNTKTIDGSTEWILLTNASWTFPTEGSVPTVAWTSSDVGTYAAIGTLTNGAGTGVADPYLQTASLSAVPEPSSYALLAGMACVGYMIVRRRTAKA